MISSLNKKLWQFSRWLVAFVVLIILGGGVIWASECDDVKCSQDQGDGRYLSCNKSKQSCWESKIREAQTAQITLQNTISILNGQISVQELRIDQTLAEIIVLEKQIGELSNRIEGLNLSLDKLTTLMVNRVGEHYKRSYLNPWLGIFSKQRLNRLLSEFKYLKLTEQHTAAAMRRAEDQRLEYDHQKTLKETAQTQLETKKQQLESQQQQLARQKKDQEYLLVETRHSETRYQQELAKTLAELEAIQSIIAGRGNESEVGGINQGETIAAIIPTASPCSTGPHLHFEVVKDNAHHDPTGYLKSIDTQWNNDPDGSFGFGGSWEWPVDNPAQINQGYGMTYYARVRRAYGGAPHTGIDIISKDKGNYQVKAVKPGKLFRGSIQCGGGLLRYVRVEHQDDGISTYFLHVNY